MTIAVRSGDFDGGVQGDFEKNSKSGLKLGVHLGRKYIDVAWTASSKTTAYRVVVSKIGAPVCLSLTKF